MLLERKGMIMNAKKLYRIYREEGLSVRRRRGRKRARGSRTQMPVPLRPNQRWSLDFLSDTFGACRRFRILAVNDDCCRENLALIADTSISGARVARELDALVRIYGKPACIVSDNGTEFHGYAEIEAATGTTIYFARPHHPWQRGTNENTNGLIRQYLPKGKSMANLTQKQCDAIAHKLNTRPRKRYEYQTPEQRACP